MGHLALIIVLLLGVATITVVWRLQPELLGDAGGWIGGAFPWQSAWRFGCGSSSDPRDADAERRGSGEVETDDSRCGRGSGQRIRRRIRSFQRVERRACRITDALSNGRCHS